MRRLHEEEDEAPPSPFPRTRAYIIGAILLVNGISQMMLIPVQPSITAHFYPELTEEELGFASGDLSASFFTGAFCASLFWGYASDKIGRRPCLLAGILGTMASVMLFGFSSSFAMACVARFLWGALNGNIGVAKTYMSEICDDSTQARGMALIAMQGGFGRLIGPAIGGLLSQPAQQYPSVFGGVQLLVLFPYALPCLVCTSLAMCGFVGAACSLQETLPIERRPRSWRHALCGACFPRCFRANAAARVAPPSKFHRIGESGGSGGGSSQATDGIGGGDAGGRSTRRCDSSLRVSAVAIVLYSLTGFYQMSLTTVVPLWLVTDIPHGGYGRFSDASIGTLFALTGPIQIATQLAFPRLAKIYGYRRLFVCALYLSGFMTALTPLTSTLFATTASRPATYVIVWVTQVGAIVPVLLAFTCVFVFVNNSAPSRRRGMVNGVAQALVACARVVGPLICSNLFASTARNPLTSWPFDYQLVFFLLSAIAIGTALLAECMLPASIEKKVKEEGGASSTPSEQSASSTPPQAEADDALEQAAVAQPRPQSESDRLRAAAPVKA